MITTWQKILVVTIGVIFGLIVGYICIKPHMENINDTEKTNNNTVDVFEQYLNTNDNKNESNSIINENKVDNTNSTLKTQNSSIEE